MRIARVAALMLAVILATAACSGGSPAAQAGGTGTAVSIANFTFQPAMLTVPVGTTVTWTNNDSTGHTVVADDGSFRSDTIAPGATFSHTFTTAGTFSYFCSLHTSMTGTVVVS